VGRRYAEQDNSKTRKAASEIHARYLASRENVYNDIDGKPHPRTGALQLVFCDQSTPHEDSSWNVYDSLRDELVRLGMSENSIRFIHEAKSDADKDRLFQSARSGTVSVLIGSTGKMGTGVNVQDRAIAVHHLDAPWRPDELTQRIGRVVRQGNQNKEVEVLVYVNEGSFDVFSWQTLARKKAFIDQVLTSTAREVEDESQDSISYAQVKALATGNPMHIRKAELDSQILKIERRQRAFVVNLARGKNGIAKAESDLERLDKRLTAQHEIAETWHRFVAAHETPKDELDSKRILEVKASRGWNRDSPQIDACLGTEIEVNKFILEVLKAHNYASVPLTFEIEGLHFDAVRRVSDYSQPSYWIVYLTTAESEMGKNPTDSQIKIEQRSIDGDGARVLQRVFNEAGEIERRIAMTGREIQKTQEQKSYYEGVVGNSEFPESGLLVQLCQERDRIEATLAATADEEDELVKDILADDDPYVINWDEREDVILDMQLGEEKEELAASVSIENGVTPGFGRGMRL